MRTRSNKQLSLGALALVALSGAAAAQTPYEAEIVWNVGGTSMDGTASVSSVMASVAGACNGLPTESEKCANSSFQQRAEASSSAAALRGDSMGLSVIGVSGSAFGFGRYVFNDVVFTDTLNPGAQGPVNVALTFTIEGEQYGNTPFGSVGVNVSLAPVGGGAFGFWNSPTYHPNGGAPIQVQTGTMTVTTGVPYTLFIQGRFSAGGNSGLWEGVRGSIVWNEPPFVLTPDFTADSAEAGIVDNVRNAPVPSVTPKVGTGWPVTAGEPATMFFHQGLPGALGTYVIGGPPLPTNLPIGTFATFDVDPSFLVFVPFLADGTGAHQFDFTTGAGASGVTLGAQAFQLEIGPPDQWYSTNAWEIYFQ